MSFDPHLIALWLMAAQGALGAFDTLFHHEGTEALPRTPQAARELRIHALRASLYAPLFIGLSAWAWHGAWAWVLLLVFAVEIGLTLWDFVVEDRTRLLPATERVTHTVLAINAGAFIALLALTAHGWAAQPTALVWQPKGWLSAWLALCGAGVGLSALRDALAARRLAQQSAAPPPPIAFGTQPQHVLVTGGTGFVGRLLVRQLLAGGHTVTVLTRNPKAAAWQFDGAVRCVARLQDIPALTPVQVVINLAGARILGWRWTLRRRAALLQSRVGLTQRLVAWMAALPATQRPWLLLSASAIGYYGVQPLGDAQGLDESAPPQPIFMSQLCQQWEAAAAEARALGVRVALLRLGFVLGQQGSLPLMLLPVHLGLGGPLGDGRQWLSWVHVHDVLRAMAHVWAQAESQRGQPPAAPLAWNLTAPEPLGQADFTRAAAQVLRRPFWLPTPGAPMRALLGEQADLLLQGQRVLPQRLLASGFVFTYPDARAALLDLCR